MDNLKISHRIFDYVHSALRDIKEDELMLILDEVEVDDELRNVIEKLLTDKEFYNSVSSACVKVFKENSG